MSIDSFLGEIESRKKKDLASLDTQLAEKKTILQRRKETAIGELQQRYSNEAKIKSEREAAKIIEAARLKAKKILFDTINANLDSAFKVIRQELKNYTQTPEYKQVLKKMVILSKKKLGDNITVRCREEDRPHLMEEDIVIDSSLQTLGGIIAENQNHTRELDLTFEELLRTHEDEIKSSLLGEIE